MKILHTVEFYYPSVGGTQIVVKQLSERLVRLGHMVTVATTYLPERKGAKHNGVKIEEFRVSGNIATGMRGEVERYQKFISDSSFDIITNFAAQQWATDAIITQLDSLHAKKILVPTGFSGLNSSSFKDYYSLMKRWMKEYDMNVFLSNDYRDIRFARENGVTNTTFIPNGASEDEFITQSSSDIRSKLGIPAEHFLVLHVGSHTGIKGHSETVEIFTRARIKNTTLLIVANDFGGGCASSCKRKQLLCNLRYKMSSSGKRLIVTTLSRQDTVAAYLEADLFLFPSNIECSPLVLFECMASRTPFLTTVVGNALEIISWSKGGMALPTYIDARGYSKAELDGSTIMFEELCADWEKRLMMREEGYRAWQQQFTWGKIAKDYEGLYKKMMNVSPVTS